LKKRKGVYSYGYKPKNGVVWDTIIYLPFDNKINQPDWEYMENYIKSLPNSDLI
jgi:hypothetical protein